MDLLSIALTVVYGYIMYVIGKGAARREIGGKQIQATLSKAIIPIGVLEKIDGQYYLFEKDSTNFLCQAEKLEDIPINLYNNKKISLAAILFPEEAQGQVFWCINGKLKLIE